MTITVAAESQLGIIQNLAKAIWPEAYGAILSQEQLDYMMNMMYSDNSLSNQLRNKNVFLLAKIDTDFIGFASYELNYDESNYTKIHKLYVLPEIQGKGVGKELINYIQENANKNSNSALILNVNKYNKAKDFYLHNQFEIADSVVVEIGNGYVMDDFIMKKNI
ncbi:GNAT family N-acetyltransferase [Flavobacterium sp.]|uniref:GNAT family N-acetyltransferase n=1 Tax=Flavobacterium sp. TaxID=239 RepID=UPI0033409B99